MNFGELFEVFCKRAGNRIERAIRLALPGEIHVRNTIGKGKFGIARETVENKRESLVAFDIARTLEEFIEDCTKQIFRRRDKALRRDLIRKLPGDQAVVICEVDIDLHK